MISKKRAPTHSAHSSQAYIPGPDENPALLLPEPESGGEPDSDPDSGDFEDFV